MVFSGAKRNQDAGNAGREGLSLSLPSSAAPIRLGFPTSNSSGVRPDLQDCLLLPQALVITGISLQAANLYGYVHCKLGGMQNLHKMATRFSAQQIFQRVSWGVSFK